jgi:Mlc titration factor MtfA (ptsG expression regulator)/Flp pilus assembly protein TadD
LAERFPRDWLDILSRSVPYYAWLPAAKQAQLRDDLRIFIAERQWVGCAGLEITDEMRVTIAAQACLLVLCIQPTYHYDRIKSILVYPGPYRHPPSRRGYSGGIVFEGGVILGEAWHRSPIVLSWQSVIDGMSDPHDGNNVVFHEFAHHLDGLDGDVNGTPPLESREQYRAWDAVTTAEYQRLVRAAREGTPAFLRDYGATNQAEFFAVATESFFERGPEMLRELPELYGVLRDFYRQDTAKWPEGPHRDSHPATTHHASRQSRHFENHRSEPAENEETRSLLRMIHLKPGSADAYFSLGVAYLNDHRNEEAEAALSDAVRLNPTDEESLLQRGIARVRLRQSAAAIADLDAALDLDPDDIEAYRARAEAKLQQRDYSAALADCAKVLRREWHDPTALYVRGLALAGTGNYTKAIRSLSSAIAADPSRAEFYADRSRLYEIIGSRQRAERDRIDAIRRDPSLAESLSKGIKIKT